MEGTDDYSRIPLSETKPEASVQPRYAGLIIRFVASLIDSIILIIVMFIPMVIVLFLSIGVVRSEVVFLILLALFILVAIGVSWFYNAYFESSEDMATPGKKVCGLKVTDLDGNRITFGRATVRYFMKNGVVEILGWVSNCLGLIYDLADVLAMYTNDRRQCIHDMVAGTVVVYA